ncbi:acetyltransferase [Methylomonas sp. UP202]|uniref:acetyltransferase n=1 Tax=Methylomonas sp. UP202 TaxID=3040943 RepID=UPI00247A049C|nr:acetyltransferase [Methylomonas sp. UP202]WGS85596.1 acetyltransferase [Methylomonas sp. UP202]
MKQRKLIIVGASGFADIAQEYFEADSPYSVVGFAVESAFLTGDTKNGLPLVPFESMTEHFSPADHDVFVAVTYTQLNRLRARLTQQAKANGYRLASYISTRAFVWPNARIGEHCFIFEDNTVQPFVSIGNDVILWSGNHIGHHSSLGDHCFISSHVVISGFCHIGENSFLGVNSTLANNLTIGKDNWIGPGIVLTQNTEDGALYGAAMPSPSRVSSLRFFKVKA